jgi:hypothetical protein
MSNGNTQFKLQAFGTPSAFDPHHISFANSLLSSAESSPLKIRAYNQDIDEGVLFNVVYNIITNELVVTGTPEEDPSDAPTVALYTQTFYQLKKNTSVGNTIYPLSLPDGAAFEVTVGELPAGLTLDGETGEITGTPTAVSEKTRVVIEAVGTDKTYIYQIFFAVI